MSAEEQPTTEWPKESHGSVVTLGANYLSWIDHDGVWQHGSLSVRSDGVLCAKKAAPVGGPQGDPKGAS